MKMVAATALALLIFLAFIVFEQAAHPGSRW